MNLNDHLGLIYKVALNHFKHIEDEHFEDLIHEGYFGLVRASKNFNPKLGKFSTIAYPNIFSYMQQYTQKCYDLIRLSGEAHSWFDYDIINIYRMVQIDDEKSIISEDKPIDFLLDLKHIYDTRQLEIFELYYIYGHPKSYIAKHFKVSETSMWYDFKDVQDKLKEYLNQKLISKKLPDNTYGKKPYIFSTKHPLNKRNRVK